MHCLIWDLNAVVFWLVESLFRIQYRRLFTLNSLHGILTNSIASLMVLVCHLKRLGHLRSWVVQHQFMNCCLLHLCTEHVLFSVTISQCILDFSCFMFSPNMLGQSSCSIMLMCNTKALNDTVELPLLSYSLFVYVCLCCNGSLQDEVFENSKVKCSEEQCLANCKSLNNWDYTILLLYLCSYNLDA